MIHIDLAKARALVDEAIAERGEDYVYEPPDSPQTCLYVHGDGTPGCLVGLALAKAGVPLDAMRRHQWGDESAADDILCELEGESIAAASLDARMYLRRVQKRQDSGAPWGAARDDANERFPE